MNVDDKKENLSFSILMANYNNAKYIEEAINSVILQTYPFWELIIVDDCSTDDSIQIIDSFLDDERIKLIKLNNHYEVGTAKNIAAANASKNVLGVLDSDDKLDEKALEIIADAYKKYPDCGVIYSTMWNCNSDLKDCKVDKKIGPIIPEKSFIFNPKISHFKTFLREVYLKTSGYDNKLKAGVDKDILLKLEEITKFKFIDLPLYYYRHHKSGISQDKNKFQARVYYYIAKCKAYQRRLNTNLPNYTLKELYKEYFTITLFKLRRTIKYLLKSYYGLTFLRVILKLLPHSQIHKTIENLLNRLK